MRPFGVVLFVAALSKGILAEQSLASQLPECAVKCLAATLPLSSCAPTDMSCLCADSKFMTAAGACNEANCTVIETLQTANATYAACGIPIRDHSATLMGVTASFGAVALLMVILRLVDRAVSAQAQLGWDDLLIGLAGITGVGMNFPIIMSAHYGFGRDIWGIAPSNITLSLHWLYFAYWMYMLAESFCQLSILAFYLRIMVQYTSRVAVWVMIALVVGSGIGNFFAMVFQCTPISFFWTGWMGDVKGHCGVNVHLFSFIRGGVEIFLDLAVLILPLPMLAKLNMSKTKKLQIMSMFCVGFVITVVSCLRIWALVQFAHSTNPTYDNTAGLYWCTTESNLFTIVACMPSLHAIFHKLLRRVRNSSTHASNGHYGSKSHDVVNKGSYLRHDSGQRQNSVPFGSIQKSTDVNIYRSSRSSSDVELVEHVPLPLPP